MFQKQSCMRTEEAVRTSTEISLRTKKNTVKNTFLNSTYDELVHRYNLFHV